MVKLGSVNKRRRGKRLPWRDLNSTAGAVAALTPAPWRFQAPGIAAVIVGLSQPSPTESTQLWPLVSEASTVQLP